MTDPTQEPTRATSSSSHRGRWVLLGGIVVFLLVIAGVIWIRPSDGPLPPANEIATMHVWLYDGDNFGPGTKLQVPIHLHQRIRSALAPARIDRDPPKCVGMGGLQIRTHKGREVGVALFSSDFKIDETYYQYPSGDYGDVGEAIDAARADASPEQP